MRFLVRLLGAIWLSTVVVVGGFAFLQVHQERQRLTDDLRRRAALIGEAVREAAEPLVARGDRRGFDRVLRRYGRPDRGIVLYDGFGSVIAATPEVASHLAPLTPLASDAVRDNAPHRKVRVVAGRDAFVYAAPLQRDDRPVGAVVVVLDAAQLNTAEMGLWQQTAIRLGVLIVILTGITFAVVRWSVTKPMERMAEWTKQLRGGRPLPPPRDADVSLFGPLASEVTGLARTLARARSAAELEAWLRLRGESVWTEERLKQFVQLQFGDRPIFVVSNREPLSHVYSGREIKAQRPASGLVTALEPVMLACGGVWVAHGSGNADMDVGARFGLPPDDARYALRRVWLSPAEEKGYYYGFANEGLWPLCHIVHERPLFRAEDWAYYREVNRKFAVALIEEMEKTEAPTILVQDYHFALLPQMVKTERPDARVALFWHIPWPNFEVFDICPWEQEILLGMLGADLVGFHTQFHCNNFLETVERALEARVEWDFVDDPPRLSRAELLERLGIQAEFIGIGVERVDYTKGLPERLRAIRLFFERYPEYRRRLVFVQIASPSRSQLPRYAALQAEVEHAVQLINDGFAERGWKPILYLSRHHDHRELWSHYRSADFCMVTSLHDGMNLVAKEFVSTRDDDDGVLILSRFTGAARELRDAILVNPYDVGEMAEAIRTAIEMPAAERTARMRRMRGLVREHNIYRWAGMLLTDLGRIDQASASLPVVETEPS
jgi:trehalose-6-phosphate synthase